MGLVAATFDCYGTLIDWDQGLQFYFRDRAGLSPDEAAAKAREWEEHQRELIQGSYRPYRDIMRESLRAVLPDMPQSHVEAFPDSILHWPIFRDVDQLARAGLKLGVLSNMDTDLLEATLRRLPVRIDFFVSAQQVRSYKPSPAHFKRALELLKCRPQDVAHCAFGAWYDIAPAKALGMRTVLVRRSKVSETGSPDAVVSSLSELPRLLAMMC